MTLPPLSKWSSQSGFTFYTWIRIENPADSKRDFYKPIILWLVLSTYIYNYGMLLLYIQRML